MAYVTSWLPLRSHHPSPTSKSAARTKEGSGIVSPLIHNKGLCDLASIRLWLNAWLLVHRANYQVRAAAPACNLAQPTFPINRKGRRPAQSQFVT